MEENARQFAANAESVEDVVFRKLALDKLHTALLQLTKEERALIYALFFDEKTESEVANLWAFPSRPYTNEKQDTQKVEKLF